MQYKLIENSLNDINHPIETVLRNRGIDDWNGYLHLDKSVVQDYNDLDNIDMAVKCFVEHYNNHNKIVILPDSDADGQTSAAAMFLYIKALDKNYPVEYTLHQKNKSHGLADKDYILPDDTKLFIIPDAGTNDIEECNSLYNKGIDIIILDHHSIDIPDDEDCHIDTPIDISKSKAIIVNNQMSDNYNNKDLSGVGIVYRFLQALDDELWEFHADNFLDLVTVGNIADVMDMRSLETRFFVEQGIKNGLKNKFLKALFDSQEFSTHGILNIHNIAWYIAPVINGVMRTGSEEERELLFKALIGENDDIKFDYVKRNGDIVQEDIYTKTARLSKNAKSRQDNAKKKIFKEIQSHINPEDKVILAKSNTKETGLLGLAAMMVADTYKHPTIIVKERIVDDSVVLNGSIRNFDYSPIEDFRQFILDTKLANWVTGHPNAAGISINPEHVSEFREKCNQLLSNVDMTPTFYIDFDIDLEDLNINFIKCIDDNNWIWGTGIKEPKVLIRNIPIMKKDIILQGADKNTVAFMIDNIKFVQFKLPENALLLDFANDWDIDDDEVITINAICEVSINEYNGVCTPQCIINDCELVKGD